MPPPQDGHGNMVGIEVNVPSGLNRNPIAANVPPAAFWNLNTPRFPAVSGNLNGSMSAVWPLPATVIIDVPNIDPCSSNRVAVMFS